MKDLDKKIELLLEASAFSLIDANNPNETDNLKKANMELCMCMHLEAQTCLLKEILAMLDNINCKLAMMNINIQDVEQAILAQKETTQQ